jgi:hypothetical protein
MLYRELQRITDRDAEQEVSGIAVPVLDALLQACKDFVPNDPVARAIDGLVTPESVESGSLRALDAALVVGQLAAALGPEKPAPPLPDIELGGPHWTEQGF